mmetsp:Transcript_96203/g.170807  ORF Transcript_96203/g.170807 Transcript_96203/m.170807 type:complete len:236 (-) Transcript_96203:460-1167(-)
MKLKDLLKVSLASSLLRIAIASPMAATSSKATLLRSSNSFSFSSRELFVSAIYFLSAATWSSNCSIASLASACACRSLAAVDLILAKLSSADDSCSFFESSRFSWTSCSSFKIFLSSSTFFSNFVSRPVKISSTSFFRAFAALVVALEVRPAASRTAPVGTRPVRRLRRKTASGLLKDCSPILTASSRSAACLALLAAELADFRLPPARFRSKPALDLSSPVRVSTAVRMASTPF